MKYIVTINEKRYEVQVEKGEASAVLMDNNLASNIKHNEKVEARDDVRKTSDSLKVDQNKASVEDTIKAPIPGVVVDIKVQEGASVKKGDILFIVEAMKMENEIMSPRDAVVSRIMVSRDKSVELGDVLAYLK
ncbi:biotin/lipoyl-containing protein [Clostridium sp. AWRP]|uniref:biotin/lipoyl-containing protein n=1 Tax=Clostridium sp. AWRP TaxID=2212991 RepID=UPI000FD7AC3C|nr:biotin/lipoyl-containing protein [Clostridium sp. AWRP]AZV57472.1 biotin/lipoyl-binding protein [Clostridium sp. AWRP]